MGDFVLMRCHCGQLEETVQLQCSFPVDNFLCHCDTCRRVTGALTFTGLRLAAPPAEVFEAKLVKFATSDKIWRYFCGTCGSHVCYHVIKEDRWGVCSGAVDQVIGDNKRRLETFRAHEYAGDTRDGGLVTLFPQAPIYLEDEGGEPVSNFKDEMKRLRDSTLQSQDSNILDVACRCGQVSLSLSRPDANDSNSKWEAGLCVCRSCRLSFSQSLVAWAFNIPFAKARWTDGTIHDGGVHKSLARFQSSDHAYRDFCKTCGASVFYYSSRQPGLMDIAFGLLRAKEGSLAKSWFRWKTDKVYYPEDAADKGLVETVQENLKSLQDVQ